MIADEDQDCINARHAAWAHQAELENRERNEPMKIPVKHSMEYEPAPAGNHLALCNAVVDLGVQSQGVPPKFKRMVLLRFELPTETISYEKDGKQVTAPMTVHRKFTATMHEKGSLRQFIESWFGKPFPSDAAASEFDLKQLLGRKCLLNLTHKQVNGMTYCNVTSAAPIPKGMPADYTLHNTSMYYDLDHPDAGAFELLPEWMRKVIERRIIEPSDADKKKAAAGEAAVEDFDDDIPF